ncbi:MAG: hypothetical protein ACXV5Q_13885, partial [Frankiaceae bacterium]
MRAKYALPLAAAAMAFLPVACQPSVPLPQPKPGLTTATRPVPTRFPTPTATPTSAVKPTPTATATATPTPTATATPTAPPTTGPTPPPVTGDPTAYSLMFANPNQPGSYVGWTPCSTLRYRLNLAAAPTTATADVTEALRRITLVTGLRFSYLGTTDYVPSATTPGTYPTDTDLVITWSDAATVPVLAGSVIGVGGAYVTYSAPAHLLRGGVSLDRQAGLPAGFGSGATTGALLLHEVGHVLGLGHETMDLLQVMYPALTASATPWYQAGDRAGLA